MKASDGPSPRAMAASTSREVVTWMVSDTLCVWSHCPPGRCSTKPRSVCTGPPRSTGCAAICSLEGSSFICDSTSDNRIGSGLLSTIPSAPLSVCSQMSATVCEKFGSVSEGIAISRWLVRLVSAATASAKVMSPAPVVLMCLPLMLQVWGWGGAGSRNCGHSPCFHPSVDELPFVCKAQHAVLMSQLGGEGIEGAGELQDGERRLVELGVAARAADDHLLE